MLALGLLSLPLLSSGCIGDAQADTALPCVRAFDPRAPILEDANITVPLNVTVDNPSDDARDVTVVIKAFDVSTGFMVRTAKVELGRVPGHHTAVASLEPQLPARSGYRIEIEVWAGGEIVATTIVELLNLGAIRPEDLQIEIGSINVHVGAASPDAPRLVEVFLENGAQRRSLPLTLEVREFLAGTNIVIAKARVPVAPLPPGSTRPVMVELPPGTNRTTELQITLWHEERIIARTGVTPEGYVLHHQNASAPRAWNDDADLVYEGSASGLTLRTPSYHRELPGWCAEAQRMPIW